MSIALGAILAGVGIVASRPSWAALPARLPLEQGGFYLLIGLFCWLRVRHHVLPSLWGVALRQASRRGDAAACRHWLRRGAPVDARNLTDCTSLAIAARYGHLEVVRILLEAGAVPNAATVEGWSPFALHYAAAAGQSAVVQVLLEAGHEPNVMWSGVTPLMQAVDLGREDLVSLLLAAGADMQMAGQEYSAVQLAVVRGHAHLVALLLDAGANPAALASPEEYSLLHLAALHGHVSVLSVLLDRVESPDPVDSHGRTPLAYAAHWGHAPAVRRLIEAGADWRRPDTAGRGPLCIAVVAGRTEVVQELLTLGADPWDRDAQSWMAAAWVGNLALLRLFVQHGGDKDYRDADGDTAFLLARRYRRKRVVQCLRSLGAHE